MDRPHNNGTSTPPLRLHDLFDDTGLLAEAMVDTVSDCLLVLDGDFHVRVANRNFFLSFQVTPEETVGRLVFELGNGQWDIPGLRRLLHEILPGNHSFRGFEVIHHFPHLGRKVMVLNAQKLRQQANSGELILLAIEDVTAAKQLQEREAYSVAVFRSSGEALVGLSVAGFIQTWNPAAERLYGYTAAEAIGASISLVVPRHLDAELETLLTRLRKGETITTETVREAKDGRLIDVRLNAAPVLDSSERIIGIAAAITDITERKRLEEELLERERRLSELVKEKELLVTEIHHRVKNNLQTVVSLLSLHANSTSDPRVVEALLEAGGRVQAIARLHESLYASANLAEINFGDYLRQLTDELRNMHGRAEISLQVDVDDVVVGMETAVPLGLIANELIVNSLKHAFPSGRAGHVNVAFEYVYASVLPGEPLDEASVRLRVEDEGIGLSPDIVVGKTNTLGLRIVRLLGQQLHAHVDFHSIGGVQVCVTFPLKHVT